MAIKVITSAQKGAKVNNRFFHSLLNYCKVNDAELMIIPLNGKGKAQEDLNESLEEYALESNKNYKLNSNISVNAMSLNPTNVDPLNGLRRLINVTTIFGSPKVALEVIPTANKKIAKIMMTTGAVTMPYYADTKVGLLSENDHKFGAIVVELEDDNFFHFRHLACNKDGEIIDLNKKYSANKVTKVRAEGLVLGDLHVGTIDPLVEAATEEIIDELRPKNLIVHDLFDGFSINPYHTDNIILKTLKAENGNDGLYEELEKVVNYLIYLKSIAKGAKIIVVASNHHEFLDRYLKECRWKDDPKNVKMALELMLAMLQGYEPIEAFVKGISVNKDKLQDIVFLGREDDCRIAGIQIANHGDKGANGAKGNIYSQDLGAGKSTTAHTHTPRIKHQIYVVGTSTKLKLEYNIGGFSSWLQTHSPIYEGGLRCLINIINGKWRS